MTRARDFLGPYRLARLIRVGQSTQVWEAVKSDDPTHYALKVPVPDKRKDRTIINELKREFEVAGSMNHPNLIHIHEFNTEGDTPYLVMEYFEHPNLKLWLRLGPQAISYFAPKFVEQGSQALFYLHTKGWVHRDVKPDNFLISDDAHVKLIDFAISEKMKTGFSALLGNMFGGTRTQGTRSYISPEQIRNQNLDARADIYSFGCVLYELITGKPPYTGDNADDLLNKHLNASVPAVLVMNDNVTVEFNDLIRRMMAKRKEDRPPSMWEFLKEYQKMRAFKVVPKPPAVRPTLKDDRKGFQ
ncbi:serine/threonine-protein kinase [Anatilimnocola sp. NA78]|uniref:serine/threonine-protein kinase n=1 Tax=Anatilimnocola sp. NA78 TaxID=3415683 RepID=UPI003CE46CB4